MAVDQELVTAIRQALEARADPDRAPQMQRYMKSTMPYLGLAAPVLREVMRSTHPAPTLGSLEDWRDTVLFLWRNATYREERYAAVALTGERGYRPFQVPEILPMYQEIIVGGAWWDYVDAVAIHRVGPLLKAYREIEPVLREWSAGEDLWERRTSIICQVGLKEAVDMPLLFVLIEPSLGRREFFLRKGIGWALRELAKRYPAVVERYVSEQGNGLSPLSRREAKKGIGYGLVRQRSRPHPR